MTMSTEDRTKVAGGREKQRGRTRAALLAAASRMLAAGATPTVAEVADAADVSRRTAYRYFTTQEQLLVEAALDGLRPAIEGAIAGGSVADASEPTEARLDRAVRAIQQNALDNEALLRTMIRLTVAPFDVKDEDQSDVPLRRGYRRTEWIRLAIAPARHQLGARRFDRLVSALTVCVGIDALVVLRDLCGLSPAGAESVTRWAAQALLAASVAEADAVELSAPTRRRGKRKTTR